MKIKSKRTGKWAVDGEPALPQVAMTEGQEYNEKQISAAMMEMLVDKNFASWVEGPEDLELDDDTTDDQDDSSDDAGDDSSDGTDEGADAGDGTSGDGGEGAGDDIRVTLQAIADGATNKNDAKAKLEAWGKEHLTFDVDKRKSLENVIDVIVKEHGNQNG